MTESAAGPQKGSTGTMTEEEAKRQARQTHEARQRQKQGLELQRERILAQRTSSGARRQALESALAQIEGELAQLGQ